MCMSTPKEDEREWKNKTKSFDDSTLQMSSGIFSNWLFPAVLWALTVMRNKHQRMVLSSVNKVRPSTIWFRFPRQNPISSSSNQFRRPFKSISIVLIWPSTAINGRTVASCVFTKFINIDQSTIELIAVIELGYNLICSLFIEQCAANAVYVTVCRLFVFTALVRLNEINTRHNRIIWASQSK